MKKTIAAIAAGVMLIAGEAAAANGSATLRVGDRVGPTADAASEFAGAPLVPLLVIAGILVLGISDASDDPESD